jgi:hypothetical protein
MSLYLLTEGNKPGWAACVEAGEKWRPVNVINDKAYA